MAPKEGKTGQLQRGGPSQGPFLSLSNVSEIKDIGDTEFGELLKHVDLGDLDVIKFNTANGQDKLLGGWVSSMLH